MLDDLLGPIAEEPLDPGGRILRVIFMPTFHAHACIELRGGASEALVELVSLRGDDVTCAAAAIPRAAALGLPPVPEDDIDLAARDGIAIRFETRDATGVRVVLATSPTAREAPAHHALAVALLALARRYLGDSAILADIGRYLAA